MSAEATVELITAEHAALECCYCNCTGEINTPLRGRPGDIEPTWASVDCQPCDGRGYHEEVECFECTRTIAPIGWCCRVEVVKGRTVLVCLDCARVNREGA